MKYELTGLKEHGIFVGLPEDDGSQTDLTINWVFQLDITFPELQHIVIKIDAKIEVTEPADHPVIGHFSASHFFNVPELVAKMKAGAKNAGLQFLATFVGISLGSMRGLAYARTYNVFGDAVFMPVVHPTELLLKSLPAVVAAMQAEMNRLALNDQDFQEKLISLLEENEAK